MTKDKVLVASQRGELFELRKGMMADWAEYLLPSGLLPVGHRQLGCRWPCEEWLSLDRRAR